MNLRPRTATHRRHQAGLGSGLVFAAFVTAFSAGEVGTERAHASSDTEAVATAPATAVPVAPSTPPTFTAATSDPVPCVPPGPTATVLSWGVKESFRSYIVGPIAHGLIATSDGATQGAENEAFSFPSRSGTDDAQTGAVTASYGGKVTLKGQEEPVRSGSYALSMPLANPTVAINGSAGVLSADTSSTELVTPALTVANLVLTGVSPTVGGGKVTYTAVPTTLHPDAAALLSNYEPGTVFDPITFALSAAAPTSTATTSAPVPVAGTGGLPATGGNSGPVLLVAVFLLAGGAILLAFSMPPAKGRYQY